MATTTNCEAMPTYDIKILIAREIGAVTYLGIAERCLKWFFWQVAALIVMLNYVCHVQWQL